MIGLTGASGSGKSAAAAILAGFGAQVIDADKIAHEVAEERETLDELTREFGDWIVDARGGFNRAQASKRAFSDSGFLSRLTEITHKYIIKTIYARLDEITARDPAAVVVLDAPIPVEKGFLDVANVVWVVSTTRETRLERVVCRDGIDVGAAESRFAAQLPDSGYERLADVVIDNNGDINGLERELRRQYESLINC